MKILLVIFFTLSLRIIQAEKPFEFSYDEIYERGIEKYFAANYELALEDFKCIIDDFYKFENDKSLVSSALLAQALCYGAIEQDQEALDCLTTLELFLDSSLSSEDESIIMPCKRKYAQINETLPIPDCIDRVEGTARTLRSLVSSSIRKKDILWIFNKFIDNLEASGIRCCTYGVKWIECVDPLIEKWVDWKAYGVPNNPYDDVKPKSSQ